MSVISLVRILSLILPDKCNKNIYLPFYVMLTRVLNFLVRMHGVQLLKLYEWKTTNFFHVYWN